MASRLTILVGLPLDMGKSMFFKGKKNAPEGAFGVA